MPAERVMLAEGGPLRLTGAEDILEQFRGSPLLTDGKLTIVSLDAIAERLGARWPMRQDLVYEQAQRVLRKGLGDQALVQRVSETEFIVAQNDLPRFAGQLRCLNCLKEILHHFFGEATNADLRVHSVTRITEDGIFGQRLDLGSVEAAEVSERIAAPTPAAEPPRSLDWWTPFVASNGRRVGVSCSLEPVLALKRHCQIGYRIASRVQHQLDFSALTRRELATLSPSDTEKIDFATLARGLDRIRSTAAAAPPPTLIAPVSYDTLQSRRGRLTVIELLGRARSFVQHGLICEISRLEGAPPAALHEAVAALRPFCLHVTGRLADPPDDDARALLGAGLDALSVQCPRAEGDAEFIEWMKAMVRPARRVSHTLFLYQVAGLRRALVAEKYGVTHVTLAPPHAATAIFIDDNPTN